MGGPVDERWLGLSGMRERADCWWPLIVESAPGVGPPCLSRCRWNRSKGSW